MALPFFGVLEHFEAEEEARQRNIRQMRIDRRILRDFRNPFHLDEEYFRRTYR